MKKPSESKVAVIGAARNVASTMPMLFEVIRESFREFRETQVFISESNSSDLTREVLTDLGKKNTKLHLFFLGNDVTSVNYKTERIAKARNHALRAVIDSNYEPDYVAVLDLDQINLGLSAESVLSCWNYDYWNVMFANQPEGYYDIYALRHDLWSPRDWIIDYHRLEKEFGDKIALNLALNSKRIKISKSAGLISVRSAFGGLGLYTFNEIKKTKYVGLNETGEPICEHLSVNLQIYKDEGKLFINPAMTNVRGYKGFSRLKSMMYEKYMRKIETFELD
jgi:hypothetical protein